jgi:hypothetical protein
LLAKSLGTDAVHVRRIARPIFAAPGLEMHAFRIERSFGAALRRAWRAWEGERR